MADWLLFDASDWLLFDGCLAAVWMLFNCFNHSNYFNHFIAWASSRNRSIYIKKIGLGIYIIETIEIVEIIEMHECLK